MSKASFRLKDMRRLKTEELPAISRRLNELSERKRERYRIGLSRDSVGIIAEVKKASPTRGIIKNISPREQALCYESGGAAGVSVLTDKNYFNGSWDDLKDVAESVKLPVLCKEFIFFTGQLDLACRLGADMALLIARILSFDELKGLYDYAISLGISPLVEIHSINELPDVMRLSPEYLMVNLRNLETLAIEFETGIEALKAIPSTVFRVCASGIKSKKDVEFISRSADTKNFLVGSSLMDSDDPEKLIREMRDVH